MPNEGIANMVIQARQKNAAQLKQYIWTSRIELTQNGTVQDTRIDQVSYGPDGSPIMQMTGSNVVNPGDTFYLAVNPTTLQTRRIQVTTNYQGDTVTVTATFATLPSGLTYPQYVDVEVPDKQLSLLVQNYDYYPNG